MVEPSPASGKLPRRVNRVFVDIYKVSHLNEIIWPRRIGV